jgi:hypothetical protein
LIYGHDGFDLDVLMNLLDTYRRLGFLVAYSNHLAPADLLVIQTPFDVALDLSTYTFIHIFDYVGLSISGLLESIPTGVDAHVFTSSTSRMDSLRSGPTSIPTDNIQNAFIPVDLKRFSGLPRKRKHGMVHIGNFKPYYAEQIDKYATNFLQVIGEFDVDVWGSKTWETFIRKESFRGRAMLREVAPIYATSDFALGMMYPFQRGVTYSGRF